MRADEAHSLRGRHVYHFGAGPALLPPEVIREIREELPDYHGTGISMLELGHRTPDFHAIMRETETDLRELMQVPADYSVLFLHGGATLQFAMLPLNLTGSGRGAYLVTGHWSGKALREAERVTRAQAAWDGNACAYTRLPKRGEWQLPEDAAYLHYTGNETIAGVEFHAAPQCDGLPLVADMTSMILSRPVDVTQHALIYAATQKNLGIAGLTVAIFKPDALKPVPAGTPSLLDYRACAEAHSLLNTPPVFAWYVTGKMLKWIKSQGGATALALRNRAKAERLYAAIDATDFYVNAVEPSCRSWMNVPFRLRDAALEPVFLREAEDAGLKNLAGHRTTGGVRASIYNAMPEAGVAALAEFMREFERIRG